MASDGDKISPISTDGTALAILIKHKMQNKLYSHPFECDRGQNKLNSGKKEHMPCVMLASDDGGIAKSFPPKKCLSNGRMSNGCFSSYRDVSSYS